ncbi:hypothetical protein TNIN_326141 [Trichonephila inaurata madagascariensis]|uniref:Uncharacterized protein n=1 Tax=Trichonephila inaurata madagascariensis TaxID=2747483 RepID=A0A8X6I4K5_9ARAC|nr:hypothetical protein TNIN_326141 [Trichonephila inaurata madagascariensis]
MVTATGYEEPRNWISGIPSSLGKIKKEKGRYGKNPQRKGCRHPPPRTQEKKTEGWKGKLNNGRVSQPKFRAPVLQRKTAPVKSDPKKEVQTVPLKKRDGGAGSLNFPRKNGRPKGKRTSPGDQVSHNLRHPSPSPGKKGRDPGEKQKPRVGGPTLEHSGKDDERALARLHFFYLFFF